jgi:predicted transcriptional regulator
METFTVEIINPKAKKLLKDLADLDLISFAENPAEEVNEEGWNSLSKEQKDGIYEAMESIKQGKGIPHEEVMSMVKQRLKDKL